MFTFLLLQYSPQYFLASDTKDFHLLSFSSPPPPKGLLTSSGGRGLGKELDAVADFPHWITRLFFSIVPFPFVS